MGNSSAGQNPLLAALEQSSQLGMGA